MGRAGSGGHSGGHSSSHHSSSHSTSSHHVSHSSSGSRARSGGSSFHSSSFGGSRGYGHSCPPPPPPHHHHHYYGGSSYGYSSGGFYTYRKVVNALAMLFIVIALVAMFSKMGSAGSIPASSYNREKADTGVAYQNNCIVDELGWFDNITSTERKLQSFYNETGVQPYIVLFDYNEDLTTDSDREDYADEWYKENIDNEGTLLFAYFAEEDTDNDVGGMVLVNGKQISSVMDSEATEIFWAYLDEYWYSDMSTDDMFVTVFDKTADRIMTKSTTGADVGKTFAIGFVVIAAGIIVIVVMNKKRANEKARNEETERILKSDIKTMEDDVLNKYL